jgi:pimeloyl-ACP methyl ester carboxylesterase
VPTLIIWGEGDPLIPLSSGRWLERHIPGARMEVLPGIGHIPMEEAPDASARILESWLANAASPPVKAAAR